MSARTECSHFIPVPTGELVRLLCESPDLPAGHAPAFREVASLLAQVLHHDLNARLARLRDAYQPFDPDADSPSLYPPESQERQSRLNGLLRELNWLLTRAHFRHMGREELEPLLAEASEWGIRMAVDFSVFEHVSMFVRGESFETRKYRGWRSLWQEREIEVPIYRRLVLAMKLRQHPRLGPGVDTRSVFLKLFKDIPRADADMLLPGARVRMNLLDRGKIGAGLLSGLGTMGYRLMADIGQFLHNFEMATLGLFAGVAGYGFKSYSDYQTTRQAYHLSLTQSLYFQNLDSNAGVLARLVDEAEQQQARTALLAWFCLWRYPAPGGVTADDLATAMDLYLDRYAQVPVLSEVGEALEHLRAFGMVEEAAGRLRPVPPETAAARLRQEWEARGGQSPAAAGRSTWGG
ncbi:MAG: DUF3754 domain-containing protein [Gemmataceae bacterium]|nr:DUF3754 domain-containing protein [Gemmataceae bacterium]